MWAAFMFCRDLKRAYILKKNKKSHELRINSYPKKATLHFAVNMIKCYYFKKIVMHQYKIFK